MQSTLAVLLSILTLAAGKLHAPGEPRPTREPSALASRTDRTWRDVAMSVNREAWRRHIELRDALLAEARALPAPPEIPDWLLGQDRKTSTEAQYGKLPEVEVDIGHGAIFPMPLNPARRFSWFQAAHEASSLMEATRALGDSIAKWRKLEDAKRTKYFDRFIPVLHSLQRGFVEIAHDIRYLESWVGQLEGDWNYARAEGGVPVEHLLGLAIEMRDPKMLTTFQEPLRPHRVLPRPFLPEDPSGVVTLPIVTDITDKRFIREVEGALDTYWNQSPWAREGGFSFAIDWQVRPASKDLVAGRIDLDAHLASFPEDQLGMTTGGLSTFVRGQVLVLGPERINPRTIAHELGHLMGFEDCYFRSLSSEGFFGLAVLEWDNPFYPDDLMCDNEIGSVRAGVW